MIINALNSGASIFMADFEDSNTPTWSNLIDGQHQFARCDPPHNHLQPIPATSKGYKLNPASCGIAGWAARMALAGKTCTHR